MSHPHKSTANTSDLSENDNKEAQQSSAEKKHTFEIRRSNVAMLTDQRGTKHRLAELAGTSGSRISLMTSGRKPVSDSFAFAIEDGLGLTRGWLDVKQDLDDVPNCIWVKLGVGNTNHAIFSNTLSATSGNADMTSQGINPSNTTLPSEQYGREKKRKSATIEGSSGFRTNAMTPSSSTTGLFDKPKGTVGPIAEALAKTILNLSAEDLLSEHRAFEILGELLNKAKAKTV